MSPTVLSVSPHPDDELIGAGATLMALRDAGWRVVNLACSLGRPDDRSRRLAELTEACRLARFDLVIRERLPPIGSDDDLGLAQRVLSSAIVDALDGAGAGEGAGAGLIVGPSPHDCHHGHEVVGRAVRDAIEARGEPAQVMFWGLWGDLPLPNLLVPFSAARLAEIQLALAAHAGELERNRFDRLVESRAAVHSVLGPERVFGFGTRGSDHQYAELLTNVSWSSEEPWRLTAPRELDASQPLAPGDGPDIGWLLHAPSVRSMSRGRTRRSAC
jgi:LmbE family N-acetylglucosaminyl deacetylase